jgi:hypothetical protein
MDTFLQYVHNLGIPTFGLSPMLYYALIGIGFFCVAYLAFGMLLWLLNGILHILQPLVKYIAIMALITGAVYWIATKTY